MLEAINSPVVSLKSVLRPSIPVPGLVICGKTLNSTVQCFKSEFNSADDDYSQGKSCNEYISDKPINASIFVNIRGYYELDQQHCHILNSSRPFNKSYGESPLVFDNSTQKIVIALWSYENANNTVLNTTADRWFEYGTFTELDDYKYTKFQIVKMPSISYLYFKRMEKYGTDTISALTGGGTGQAIQKSVKLDETFTSFAIAGFGVSSDLWEVFRIIPSEFVSNLKTNSQEYLVQLWYDRIEFTLFQLTANMGGFLSVLSFTYLILFGSRKINPWGVIQRH
ncbi:2587_t:CDS:2, partial [Scutellospora calospora]